MALNLASLRDQPLQKLPLGSQTSPSYLTRQTSTQGMPLMIERPQPHTSQSSVRPKALYASLSMQDKQFKVRTYRGNNIQNSDDQPTAKNKFLPSGRGERMTSYTRKRTTTQGSDDDYDYQNMMWERIMTLDQVIEDLRKYQGTHDIQKVYESVSEITRTLQKASRNEIDLNRQKREVQLKNLDMVNVQTQLIKTKNQTKQQKLEQEEQDKKLQICQSEYQRVLRELHNSNNKIDEQNKKLHCLEKRIEMLLEKNLHAHQDTLRNTLTDLIKETEEQKRSIRSKAKEIERLKDVNQKLVNKNVRLTKKLESLKTKRVGKDQDEDEPTDTQQQTNNFAFDPSKLPLNLDFKFSNLSAEHNNLILDLLEHGHETFTNQYMLIDDNNQRRDVMSLVSSQVIQNRDFGEKFNSLMIELETMLSYNSMEDYQVHLSKGMRSVFNSDIAQLWIIDQMTGFAHTFDPSRKELRALLSHGAFSDAIINGHIVNRINDTHIILYRNETQDVYGDRVLIIPMVGHQHRVYGLLEIRGINKDQCNQQDVQYFGLAVSKISRALFQKIIDWKALQHELRYRDLFYTEFIEICKSSKLLDFQQKVEDSIFRIFQISQSTMTYVKNGKLIKLKKNGQKQTFSLTTGIVGMTVGIERPQIISSIQRNVNFDEFVDVNSILPVYCCPIKFKDNIEVVLQFVLKSKYNAKQDKLPFVNQANIGFKIDSIDYDAHKYCEFLSVAYSLLRESGKLSLDALI